MKNLNINWSERHNKIVAQAIKETLWVAKNLNNDDRTLLEQSLTILAVTKAVDDHLANNPPETPKGSTYFVIAPGYYGRGKTIPEAAKNCLKAGASKSNGCALIFIDGDDKAEFISIMAIEFTRGAKMHNMGYFQKLSHLLNVQQN